MKPSSIGLGLRAFRKKKPRSLPVLHGGGGSRPRVQHVEGIPIGSRQTVPGNPGSHPKYMCYCVECRKARGQYPKHLSAPKTPKKAVSG
jgi:hypothetical protein